MESHGKKIKRIREDMHISQDEAARVLGMTRPTYKATESEERDITVKELRKLCKLFGMSMEQFLFSSTQSDSYENRMTKYKQVILNCLQYGSSPSESKMTKSKLAALVYMCDFAAYYQHKESLSGLPYRHTEYGPIVDAYYRMIDELYDEGAITIELRGRAIQIHAIEPAAPHSLLSDEHVALIKDVCTPWRVKATQSILDFVKHQTPWKDYTQGEIIPYRSILDEPTNPFIRLETEDSEEE